MAKILVVDDDRDNADSMALLFEAMGHETRIARNGQQAFDSAKVFQPHIAFMDLDMPVLSGYEAALLIRAAMEWPPYLVAVTGNSRPEVEGATRAVGFNAFLRKPAEPDALLAFIEAAAPKLST